MRGYLGDVLEGGIRAVLGGDAGFHYEKYALWPGPSGEPRRSAVVVP